MAKFRITGPDGATYEITAPDDASEQDVLAYAQQQFADPKQSGATGKWGAGATGQWEPPSGFKRGFVDDPITGLKQAAMESPITRMIDPTAPDRVRAEATQGEAQYQRARGSDSVDLPRLAGNVVNPVNLAIMAATKAPAGASGMRLAMTGAGQGGLMGALAPQYGEANRSMASAIGAATGAAMGPVAGALARVVSPNASKDQALALLQREGIKPSIGQSLGGLANKVEERMMSVPFFGDSIAAARGLPREQFNRAALTRTLTPIGGKVDDIGSTGVANAGDQISAAFDRALSGLKGVTLDTQARQELATLRQMAAYIPEDKAKPFSRFLNDRVLGRMAQNGGMAAETFQMVDSELGKKIAATVDPELKSAYLEAQRILRDGAARGNPTYAAELSKAREAWANLVRVEGAAKKAAGEGGVFTPNQLLQAVREADKSTRKRATARGTALLQDLAVAGQQKLATRTPNSGTADRAMQVGAVASLVTNPLATASALLAGPALYNQPTQNVLRYLATQRPTSSNMLADIVRRSGALAVPATQATIYGKD